MSRGGRGPPNTDGMVSLKVDNLTYRTTPEMLKRLFEKFGDVGDVYIPRDHYTNESRGFAFVRFFDQRDADDAIHGMDGVVCDGRELRVQMARHTRPNQSNYGYSRRGPPSPSPSRRRRRSHSRSRSRSRDRDRHSTSDSRGRRQSPARGSRRSRSRSPQHSRSQSPVPPNKSAEYDRSRSGSRDHSANNSLRRRQSRSLSPI